MEPRLRIETHCHAKGHPRNEAAEAHLHACAAKTRINTAPNALKNANAEDVPWSYRRATVAPPHPHIEFVDVIRVTAAIEPSN